MKGKHARNTTIWLDMDGTIADLYREDTWLEEILTEREGLFSRLEPMEYLQVKTMIEYVQAKGYTVGVLTWTPKNVSQDYCNLVAREKRQWIEKFFPTIDRFIAIPYGTNKADYMKPKDILIDDDSKVLDMAMKRNRIAINRLIGFENIIDLMYIHL